MGVFQNEVGRPSNETLKKRRLIIGGGIGLAVLLLVGIFAFAGNSSLSASSNQALTTDMQAALRGVAIDLRYDRLKKGLFNKYYRVNQVTIDRLNKTYYNVNDLRADGYDIYFEYKVFLLGRNYKNLGSHSFTSGSTGSLNPTRVVIANPAGYNYAFNLN